MSVPSEALPAFAAWMTEVAPGFLRHGVIATCIQFLWCQHLDIQVIWTCLEYFRSVAISESGILLHSLGKVAGGARGPETFVHPPNFSSGNC